MTPAFTTKCLVQTCSPSKHDWRRPYLNSHRYVSIRDHETDRGRGRLARQGFRPREGAVITVSDCDLAPVWKQRTPLLR